MANLGGGTFPQVDADKELNPAKNKQFQVDSVSSRVAEIKEEKAEEDKKVKGKKKEDATDKLKTTIIVSGIVVAVAGAIYAITKKLKEKST
ncbi:hypothetical protein M9H77_24044 [Catharanthus roseus]|uniref:Uncharacterized protein n=1 Tax=Catharanthus roseus TaxID=4058 RepID=A0ACC0AVE6_CATRO|nr:hypothetical protein M9H77_24044 [Catharanthus roseus]